LPHPLSSCSPLDPLCFTGPSRKVDARLPGKGNSNSHGARPVHLIITMIKWIQTSRLSIKNSLSTGPASGPNHVSSSFGDVPSRPRADPVTVAFENGRDLAPIGGDSAPVGGHDYHGGVTRAPGGHADAGKVNTAPLKNSVFCTLRCRAYLEQISQLTPDSGLGLSHFQYLSLSHHFSCSLPAQQWTRLTLKPSNSLGVLRFYRGTSLIRNSAPLRHMPMALWWS